MRLLVIALGIALALYSCLPSKVNYGDEFIKRQEESSQDLSSFPKVLAMAEEFPFIWDTMVVVPPYSHHGGFPIEFVEQLEIGIEEGIEMRDDICVLVFSNKGDIVYSYSMVRSVDFSRLGTTYLTRADTILIDNSGLVGFRYHGLK